MPAADYNNYMRNYMHDRYHRLMGEARERLGGKCVICGSVDELEIDHIDPSTKSFTVSSGTSKPLSVFWAEVEKCQLLCKEHHLEKSTEEQSVGHGEGLTGKRNCVCDKCRPLKNAYNRRFKQQRKIDAAA